MSTPTSNTPASNLLATNSGANDLGLTANGGGCACGAAPTGEQTSVASTAAESSDVTREQYLVAGMTCSHCVSSVTEELSSVDGVRNVSVDLDAGGTSRVTVESAAPIPAHAVRAAITEAGYELIDA